jgi:hypothetical protein
MAQLELCRGHSGSLQVWIYVAGRWVHVSTCHGQGMYLFTCCNSSNPVTERTSLPLVLALRKVSQVSTTKTRNLNGMKWKPRVAYHEYQAACHTPTERVMSVSMSPVQSNTFGRPVRTCAPRVSVSLYKRLSYVNQHCQVSVTSCNSRKLWQMSMELDIKISIPWFNKNLLRLSIYNSPTNALFCNKTLIQMSHTKTLKITPTCFDYQLIIVREIFYPG